MFKFIKYWSETKHEDRARSIVETDKVILDCVSVKRGNTNVLSDISLDLAEKRIGIIGNNGSGKSSLIKLLNGLNLPDKGEVNVFGYNTRTHQRRLPSLVGFIFQNPDHQLIFPTVLEELAFGLEQLGEPSETAKDHAREFLQKFYCEELSGKPIHALSEGQKQLVCILAVLIMRPRLLLLDEPFASLDLPTRKRLLLLLEDAAERLVMVSHDLQVFSGFEWVVWLHAGRIRHQGAPAEVIAAYREFSDIGRENGTCLAQLL